MQASLFIIIPTYNEAGTIRELIDSLRLHLPEAMVLVVDDASPDGTADLVQNLNDERVSVLRRSGKLGLGSAYQDGFRWAIERGAEYIVQMDADFSHNPADIKRMLAIAKHFDLIVGSRYIPGGKIVGWNMWRMFISRSAMIFSRLLLRLRVRDVTSGFRLWRSSLLKSILETPIESSGYAFQEEMVYRAVCEKARIQEIPITFTDRRVGQSKLSWHDVYEFFIVIVTLKLFFPRRRK